MKPYALNLDLFKFAYFPNLWDTFQDLADMAYPEGWQYWNPPFETVCPEVEILAKYFRTVYRKSALDFNEAPDQYQEDLSIYMEDKTACFHTGLYTRDYKAIYALFVENIRRNVMQPWVFSEFILEDCRWLSSLELRPEYPVYPAADFADAFYLDWPIRLSFRQISEDREMLAYLPEALREPEALQKKLQMSLAQSRKQAEVTPDYAAPLVYHERVQYTLPLHLTDGDRPDMAIVLAPMEGLLYAAHHLILPEMAYNSARLLGFIRAGWLKDLVIDAPLEMPKVTPQVVGARDAAG